MKVNPYKAPESSIGQEVQDTPRSIQLVYWLMVVSFFIFLIQELLYTAYSEVDIFGVYNYIFIPIWAVVMYFIFNSIRNRKQYPRMTFLILEIIVVVMSIFDPLSPYDMYISFAEAFCFLIIFFLLNKKTSLEWFG